MPTKRRVLSCQSCRRLKTRCDVFPGSTQCVRCATLRLECSLPSGPRSAKYSGPIAQVHRLEQASSGEGGCHCAARLDAIEASLTEIKQLLRSQLSTPISAQAINEDNATDDDGDDDNVFTTSPLGASTDRIAPIKVVRELNNIITGPVTANSNDHIHEQLSDMGLSSRELTTALYRGFEQVTSGSPFVSSTGTTVLEDNHPLLFAVCLLVGVRTVPGLNGSQLHRSLYALTRKYLGVKMLNTPLQLSTIHAILVFSAWILGTDLRDRYIDSWFLSGVTITHCMLSIDLSALLRSSDFHGKEVREKARTWNLASLVHLKFSIGTGRPSVVTPEQLRQWVEATSYLVSDPIDKQIMSELKLYLLLYDAVYGNSCTVTELWRGIEDWKGRHLDEGTAALRFAYSCVTLIVARWELTKLPTHLHTNNTDSNPRITTLIDTAVHHAQILLREVMSLCASTAFVRTTYDILLSAYAGLTLVEYSSALPDLQAAYHLMENVQMQSGITKMVEPVFAWATGVMQKRAGDQRKETARMAVHCVMQDQEPSSDWIPSLLVDSVDPSLLSSTNYCET